MIKPQLTYFLASICLILSACSNDEAKEESVQEKTAFVLNQKLFNEFDLTKELEIELNKTNQQRQAILDSLRLNIESLGREIEASEEQNQNTLLSMHNLQKLYQTKSSEFEMASQAQENQHFESIWKRLNDYVKQYAKDNGFSFIFGATGDGGIMYAEESKDLTPELIDYCNNKYRGN